MNQQESKALKENFLKYEKKGKSTFLINESNIWEEFKKGNESSFISIYQLYFSVLYAYGCKFTKDEEVIKDCIQDLFIYLRKNRSQLGKTDSIKFYLFKCLKRRILAELRQKGRYQEIESQYYFQFSFSPEDILINQQIDQEKQVRLNKAIQNLSPRKREIVFYFYFEGLPYNQIQEIMGLENIKSARNLLYKALETLKTALK